VHVKHWMTPRVITASPEEGLKGAWKLLKEHGIRHLPVLEEGRLVGIVTDRDLRQALPPRPRPWRSTSFSICWIGSHCGRS